MPWGACLCPGIGGLRILNVRFSFPPTNEAHQGNDGHTRQCANRTQQTQDNGRKKLTAGPALGRHSVGHISDHI